LLLETMYFQFMKFSDYFYANVNYESDSYLNKTVLTITFKISTLKLTLKSYVFVSLNGTLLHRKILQATLISWHKDFYLEYFLQSRQIKQQSH